jgi:DNA invertase Pin-like site-specific DNA recombinase
MAAKLSEAVAYLRTSSATNVGPEKDSERRQREAIHVFAKRAGFALVEEFSDPGVSGADPIAERPLRGYSTRLRETVCASSSSRTPRALPESS